MANTRLVYPDPAINKFSGTDPDQDAESFIQLIERKINFALGDAPADAGELANDTFRKKAMFTFLLRGPAAEWYENNITNATTWEKVRTIFITRFSDWRNNFRYRMEVELCIRGNGEEIWNFLHCIKRTVDKGWPNDLNGFEAAHHAAEREAQGRQRRQGYIDYSVKGLRPRYLQRKAQDYLMENPNATSNDFSTRIIQRDVSFQVSSNFVNDEEQTNAQMATFGQEMKNLRSEVQEHQVYAVEENPRTVNPNQKRRQNATIFCNYCRTNGLTLSWCRKKIRDEKLKRIGNKKTAENQVNFAQNYNKKRGPDHGSEQWTRGQDFQRRNQNYNNGRPTTFFPASHQKFFQGQTSHMGTNTRRVEDHMVNAKISHSVEATWIGPEVDLSIIRMGTGETMGTFLVLHGLKGETSHKITPIANQEVISLTSLLSADLTIDLRPVLHIINKSSHKAIIRHHLMWFASPQFTIPLMNYQIFAR